MPIFEYKCNDCGKEFEELVFDRDECPECTHCGSENTAKLMSACRAIFGGGAPAPEAGEGDATAPAAATDKCAGCTGDCSSCG